MNIFNRFYYDLLEEGFSEDQENASLNVLIRNKVGYSIWKFKNKPENQQVIEQARQEVLPIFERLKTLASSYSDNPSAKNNAHLTDLTRFYLQVNDFKLLEREYNSYMSIPALWKKNYIKTIQEFRKWAEEIHKVESIEKLKNRDKDLSSSKEQKDETTNDDPNKVYEDDKVIVLLANNINSPNESVKNCIKYGKKSTLCISGSSARSYYHQYRWESKLTTYFVWLKKENRFILIDVSEDGTYQYNNIKVNNDISATTSQIIRKYPDVEEAFQNNVFKSIPIEGKELEFYEKFYQSDIEEFRNEEDIITFSEIKELDWSEWEWLNQYYPQILSYVLKANIELTDEVDIPEWVLKKYPSLEKRYWVKKQQNVEKELNEWDDDDEMDFTDDEYKILVNIEVPDIFLKSISQNAEYSYEFAKALIKNNKEVPDIIINGISQDAEQSYYFAEFLIKKNKEVPDIIIKSILQDAKQSYEFARFLIKDNKDVPDIIINGISKDANYSYGFADFLIKKNKEVPDIIINGISQDAEYSYYFARFLIENNKEVPEIIKNKSKEYKDDLFKENYFNRLYEGLLLESLTEEFRDFVKEFKWYQDEGLFKSDIDMEDLFKSGKMVLYYGKDLDNIANSYTKKINGDDEESRFNEWFKFYISEKRGEGTERSNTDEGKRKYLKGLVDAVKRKDIKEFPVILMVRGVGGFMVGGRTRSAAAKVGNVPIKVRVINIGEDLIEDIEKVKEIFTNLQV